MSRRINVVQQRTTGGSAFYRVYDTSDGRQLVIADPALAAKRWAAKQAKDFAAADALRKELAAAGWSMLDSKTDYKLEPLKK